jgi:hypothetical protein
MKKLIFTGVCFAAALMFFVGCEEQQKPVVKTSQPQAEPMKHTVQQHTAEDKQYAPPAIADAALAAEGVGAIRVTVSAPEINVFVVPFNRGIDFSKEGREQLRDAFLQASPIENGKAVKLNPGRYVIAARKSLPRYSEILNDLGQKANGNLFIGASKDSGYELVVGGGIQTGALFKAVKDVYLSYSGAFFAEGSGIPNQKNVAKYGYLRLQGTKDIMFRFLKGNPNFELWLLSECEVKSGFLLDQKLKLPGE